MTQEQINAGREAFITEIEQSLGSGLSESEKSIVRVAYMQGAVDQKRHSLEALQNAEAAAAGKAMGLLQ